MGLIATIKNIGKINKLIAKIEENKTLYQQLLDKLHSVYALLSDILDSLSTIKQKLREIGIE